MLAVDQVLPLLNYHENFRTYFARGAVFQYFTDRTLPCFRCCMICPWKGRDCLLLYDFSLKRKKMFRCCMTCLWKEKNVSLLFDLSLKSKTVFVAVWFVLNSAIFYFMTYFTVRTPYRTRSVHILRLPKRTAVIWQNLTTTTILFLRILTLFVVTPPLPWDGVTAWTAI